MVIPAKDEERNIAWVLGRMPTSVDEVILVDGLSRDATIDVARMAMPDVVVVHESKPGKGHALAAGFAAASGAIIVMLDADGSMDPADIPQFVEAIRQGNDVAKGSRFLPGGGTHDMTLTRRIGHVCLLHLANVLYGTSHTDLCYGYVAFQRQALESLKVSAAGFEIEMQLVARTSLAKLSVIELASVEYARRHGASNLRIARDGLRVLWTMLRELRWRPPVAAVDGTLRVSHPQR